MHQGLDLCITDCRIKLNQPSDERLKAFASIVFNDQFTICDMKVIRGNTGLFVAMPSRRRKDGRFHDVAHPIVPSLREHIEEVVLGEYHKVVDGEASERESTVRAWGPDEAETEKGFSDSL